MKKVLYFYIVLNTIFLIGCPNQENNRNLSYQDRKDLKRGDLPSFLNRSTNSPKPHCPSCETQALSYAKANSTTRNRASDAINKNFDSTKHSSEVNKYSNSPEVKKLLSEMRENLTKKCKGNPQTYCTGSRPAGSLGKCYINVKVGLARSGLVRGYLPGAHAKNAHTHGTLKRSGFKNIKGSKYKSASSAPIGAILVYSGGTSGHIEVKTGKNSYMSDFVAKTPIDSRNKDRRLVGIYIKPV